MTQPAAFLSVMAQPNDSRNSCPACYASESDPVWPSMAAGQFRLEQCRQCGLVYTVPQLNPQQMLAYYDDRYYGRKNVRFSRLFEGLVNWFRRRRADKICRFVSAGRALDVGCGRGHILDNLRQRGWTVQGVELNEAAVSHARDVLGLDVTVERFDPDRYGTGTFDLVILWHVLEHLPDVGAALAGCARILKPGGLLALSVPNLESWQAKLTRYHWFHLDLPRHYSHFSERWLRSTLEPMGLRVMDVNHFAFEQNPFGWIQSILNGCGIKRNLLYELLKSSSARSIERPWRQFPFQSFLSFAGLLSLLLPACFMLLPESPFRRGATIDLFAVRSGGD
ncbi:MAG: class I SAM-dependent methyltransferase [Planctomycetes bacterium]|nr:class I SAM-dependent methyltransferase [Planctomycetota bacterium]